MFKQVNTESEIDTVAHLAQTIWTEFYVPIMGKDQTEYMLQKLQSTEAIHHQIHPQNCLYFLLQPDKHPIGYLAVQPRRDDLLIRKLYVLGDARGQGNGSRSLRFVEQLARKRGKSIISLKVNHLNCTSIATCSRCGFHIADTLTTNIGHGIVLNDYLMQKQIQPSRPRMRVQTAQD